MTVHYETHCPASQEFIVGQLAHVYRTIPDIIHLTLVPYGNAHETYNPVSEMYEFDCQHGAEECLGNLIHVRSRKRKRISE